ncbi:MAG TPA: response regulator transcription factor [Ramlibacter sp.]|uniref:response regulator transcription factor n=1 Tax=Ramlibacter sp. TaxID=1917967 RepID=UPI002ED5CE57
MKDRDPPVRLLVVDDHALSRRGLAGLLAADPRLQVAGEAADAADAVRKAQALRPDVILLGDRLRGTTVAQALADLKQAAPAARIVLLAAGVDESDLHAALRGGASGYLLKSIEGDALCTAIQRVMHGEPVMSPEAIARLVAAFQAPAPGDPPAIATRGANDPIAQLSPREQDVLGHIARGASNREVAQALGIAETTVKIHVQHILRKLGVSSRLQAAVVATQGMRGGRASSQEP